MYKSSLAIEKTTLFNSAQAAMLTLNINQQTIMLTGNWLWHDIAENNIYTSIIDIVKQLQHELLMNNATNSSSNHNDNNYGNDGCNNHKSIVSQRNSTNNVITIDCQPINELDTCGCYFIGEVISKINMILVHSPFSLQLAINDHDKELLERILDSRMISSDTNNIIKPIVIDVSTCVQDASAKDEHSNRLLMPHLGATLKTLWRPIRVTFDAFAFFGHFVLSLLSLAKNPNNLKLIELNRTIIDAGMRGTIVASLLSLLIGATLAYEMSPQFITYGANLYIVNFLGIALLKEVSPLLTAIIVAGRTGSSITAEIGTQKIQEEIDALKAMGISPMNRIVLPKVLGVLIALPIITAIADIISMLGGAIVANSSLGISFSVFLSRVNSYVSISNYTDGIIKSFAFALAIALTGCYYGFKVQGNANSIGLYTTRSVVISIILVIFLDAIFAIIFNQLGI